MRLVTAASADNTVQPSMKGSSGAPTPPIWIRWSITENHTKPWFSAHCAFAFTASNASAGSGQNHQEGLWMPNFMRISPISRPGWDHLLPSLRPSRGTPGMIKGT
jgi:hypothetical protein